MKRFKMLMMMIAFLGTGLGFGQVVIHTNFCSVASPGWTFTNGTISQPIQQGLSYWLLEDADIIISEQFNVASFTGGLSLDFEVGTYGSGTPDRAASVEYSLDNGLSWSGIIFTSSVPSSSTLINSGTFLIPSSVSTQLLLRFRKNI